MDKLDKKGKGIVLMHDIHKNTAKALPLLLDRVEGEGLQNRPPEAKGAGRDVAEFDSGD